MSVIGHSPLAGASGAAGAGEATYVDDVFSTFLYTGDNTTGRDIVNGIDLSGEGGLVWVKRRATNPEDHVLLDTERGPNKFLMSNRTNSENTSGGPITAFNSNGFEVDNNGYVNGNNDTYVSWTFRKAPKFFDIVTYSGTGSAQNISHSLGSVPGMIIIHCRDGSHDWEVYHRSIGATKSLHLNKTDAPATDSTVWNNTTPTSSVFTVGTSSNVNQNGHGYVAYVFAHDEQAFGADEDEAIVKCGNYTGNGNSNGPSVDLGFEPQWLLTKRTGDTGDWVLFDNMRGIGAPGVNDKYLVANTSNAESTGSRVGIYSTGFQPTTSSGIVNGNGSAYIYMAIRRPHKPPEAGTEVFAVNTRNGNETANTLSTAGFPVDFAIITARNVAHWACAFDRLRGAGRILNPHSTRAEVYNITSLSGFDSNTAIELGADSGNQGTNRNSQTYVDHLFKRAPGLFDVMSYTGTGSSGQAVNHNLGVIPEMIILKDRTGNSTWFTYHTGLTSGSHIDLNHSYAESNDGGAAFALTSTTITFDRTYVSNINNSSRNYVAYLFATLGGISKVGSYTGTGSDVNVDCGFTAGARFVLIKRIDSHFSDWYYWDTARGIVSGNDPYLRFSSTDAETTNTDYIDPLNAGFTVTSSAPAALNASGGTYIFLAIA